jgi:hypothetical protein
MTTIQLPNEISNALDLDGFRLQELLVERVTRSAQHLNAGLRQLALACETPTGPAGGHEFEILRFGKVDLEAS